jgi:hypothetical protein
MVRRFIRNSYTPLNKIPVYEPGFKNGPAQVYAGIVFGLMNKTPCNIAKISSGPASNKAIEIYRSF